VVAERLTDAIGVIVLIVLGSASFAEGRIWALAGSLAVVIGMVFIIWPAPGLKLASAMERGPVRLRPFAPKLREALISLRVVASPAALIWPTFLSVIAWGSEGVALFVILRGFGSAVEPTLAVFFYATATLAGALVPLPGGLGLVEAMIQEQLVRLGGVPLGQATAAMMLIRFATLWWAVVVGFIALFLLRARFPTRLRDDSALPDANAPSASA
jgi:uncharacterized membrane protein YbhN (UPF0104 family)